MCGLNLTIIPSLSTPTYSNPSGPCFTTRKRHFGAVKIRSSLATVSTPFDPFITSLFITGMQTIPINNFPSSEKHHRYKCHTTWPDRRTIKIHWLFHALLHCYSLSHFTTAIFFSIKQPYRPA